MWSANRSIDFQLVDSHDKTASVRDNSRRDTLRRALVTRLRNSKQFLLIVTSSTRLDTDWVPFEIRYAIDECELPIIACYPDYSSILAPADLSPLWPEVLNLRIRNGPARVIHVPFRLDPVMDAINRFDVSNTNYPTDGYGYYNRQAHSNWGLL